MKAKKALILWLCFYALELTGTLLIIFLNREDWIFNGFSAFPIFYALVCAFLVWYLPSIWNYRRDEEWWIVHHLFYRKHFDERQARMSGIAKERNGTWKDPLRSFGSRVCLALIPFFLIFVFFFPFEPKIASFAFGMMIYALAQIFWLVALSGELKEAKAHRRKRQKELEEQQKREELGKWK